MKFKLTLILLIITAFVLIQDSQNRDQPKVNTSNQNEVLAKNPTDKYTYLKRNNIHLFIFNEADYILNLRENLRA
ncbi:MAG: hypothetical protein Q9M91_07435 [Candidatus Dojkabacteria bacterium]|nr:hypothetical protein [Candidatus Dojkabacteria bacterium]